MLLLVLRANAEQGVERWMTTLIRDLRPAHEETVKALLQHEAHTLIEGEHGRMVEYLENCRSLCIGLLVTANSWRDLNNESFISVPKLCSTQRDTGKLGDLG